MKPYEMVIGICTRIEYNENNGELYLIFKITDEKWKQRIKQDWTADIEFQIIDRKLVKENI